MVEPESMILPMLREIRQEMNKRFQEMDKRFDAVDNRLNSLEAGQKSIRHALSADTMMSRMMVGEFEERIEALEKELAQLKSRIS